jgi:hypothetical protein
MFEIKLPVASVLPIIQPMIEKLSPLSRHLRAVLKAVDPGPDYLPVSTFDRNEIQLLVQNSQLLQKMASIVIKRQGLSISVHERQTCRQIRHLTFIVYCKTALLRLVGIRNICCPASLFYLYGANVAFTTVVFAETDAALYEELRRKT